jgi:surface antigen
MSLRTLLIALPLLAAPIAMAGSTAAAARNHDRQRCERNEARHQGGGLLGGLARGALGRFGGGTVANVVTPVGSLLGDAIMNLLDCREQRQAANATEEATRGGVGTTSAWQSETRRNVSGSSTVTAAEPAVATSAAQCLTVTDVVIIDGEETRAPKRMCRTPPSNKYERA